MQTYSIISNFSRVLQSFHPLSYFSISIFVCSFYVTLRILTLLQMMVNLMNWHTQDIFQSTKFTDDISFFLICTAVENSSDKLIEIYSLIKISHKSIQNINPGIKGFDKQQQFQLMFIRIYDVVVSVLSAFHHSLNNHTTLKQQ